MSRIKYSIGKIYILRDVDETDIKAKFIEIDRDGYYVFKITTRSSELEEFWTKVPEENVFEK